MLCMIILPGRGMHNGSCAVRGGGGGLYSFLKEGAAQLPHSVTLFAVFCQMSGRDAQLLPSVGMQAS
jgi:hypothetical protein